MKFTNLVKFNGNSVAISYSLLDSLVSKRTEHNVMIVNKTRVHLYCPAKHC